MVVVLSGVDPVLLATAAAYVDALHRECSLARIDAAQGAALGASSARLAELAVDLVPHLEQIADWYRAAERREGGDGSVVLRGPLDASMALELDQGIAELLEVDELGRRGGLLVEEGPAVVGFVAWAWAEAAAQLRGAAPTAYPGGGVAP